jgi:UDP:flavonoid glycosyltransferase YjiC (YdhE family)
MPEYRGRPRQITIVTVGSRGDVQPYVALALGLQRVGYHVTIATHELFRALVADHGLAFAPIAGDPRALLTDPRGDRWLDTGRARHLLPAARAFLRAVPDFVERLLADVWRVAQESDLLIYSAVAAPARSVAERLGIPAVAALLQPLHPTRAFPAIGLPTLPRLGARFNALTHRVAGRVAWWSVRRPVNAWRRTTLGLPPYPASSAVSLMGPPTTPTLYGFSPHVVPRPGDWPPATHVTGYWIVPLDPSWRPPVALVDFLAAGPPPISIGFGSMTPAHCERLTAIALEALGRAGQRGVLLRGWGGLGADRALPDTVFGIDDVPHEWLFPRMAAVVHHGGCGTTAAALRAGVPSIVIPLGFDQPFWARRVAALGVGPPPIHRRNLSAENLAAAIARAVRDPVMRSTAAALGAVLRAERGVDIAVDVITRVAAPVGGTAPAHPA